MPDSVSPTHQPGSIGVLDVAGLRRFVKVCRMPMTLFNLETRLMDSVNEAFAVLLGYTPEELEGRGPAVLHADQAGADESIAIAVRTVLDTGTIPVERALRCKNGECLWDSGEPRCTDTIELRTRTWRRIRDLLPGAELSKRHLRNDQLRRDAPQRTTAEPCLRSCPWLEFRPAKTPDPLRPLSTQAIELQPVR